MNMDSYFDDFRINLKYYRELKGWSQVELSIQSEISKGQIGNIESGKSKPSFDNIVKLSCALEIHPADLFLRDSSKYEDREIFSKYKHTIIKFNQLSQDERASLERYITERSISYQNSNNSKKDN